jgi:hypothetical protein
MHVRKSGAILVVLAVLFTALAPAVASAGGRHGFHHHGFHHHGPRVFVGFGPWWGPYPYWYYPPPTYVYTPPPVVVQEPPVYIQQEPAQAAPAPESYWYYCSSSKSYYPNVQSCPEPWLRVAPRTE